MFKACGVVHTNYIEGDLKLYVGEAKRVGKCVYFYDGTNLYRMTIGPHGCFVKIKYAKTIGAGGQDFFLCWKKEIDRDTVWLDGSLTEFDSEVRSRLCELLWHTTHAKVLIIANERVILEM